MELTTLFTREQIAERVAELGLEIDQKLPPGEIVAVCVLKGAATFFTDLVRAIPRDCLWQFLTVRSYGKSTETSGVPEMVHDLTASIEGKHVLLVEDIVDTGLSLKFLIDTLTLRKPASLHTATALSKPSRRRVQIEADFTGFSVPDKFIVGYGLDIDQHFRSVPYFAALPGAKP